MKFLEGYKTYIVAALAGVAAVLMSLGYISESTMLMIDSILAPVGLAFLRAGVKK